MELELEDIIQSLTKQIGDYARKTAMLEATINAMAGGEDGDDERRNIPEDSPAKI